MRCWEASTGLFIEDSPGLFWVFGALFVFVGAIFVLGPLGLATNAADVSLGVRIVIFSFGTIAVGVGLWVWKRSPLSRVHVNVTDRYVLVTRWGLTGREEIRVDFAEVHRLELESDKDSEGDPVFRPLVRLRNNATVLLSLLHVHDRTQVERVIQEVALRIGCA